METILHSSIFEKIQPNATTSFTLKNPLVMNGWLHSPELKITVLDSMADQQPPLVAVMILPRGREHDPLVSTKSGRQQLLKTFFNVSRIFVVSNFVAETSGYSYKLVGVVDRDRNSVRDCVSELLKPLYPLGSDSSRVRFVDVNDWLVFRNPIGMGAYKTVSGESSYVVTDELFKVKGKLERRRRLRYEETGNMIHAEVLLKKRDGKDIVDVSDVDQDKVGFFIDLDEILEPHNKAMVFGIKSLMLENEGKQFSFFNRFRIDKKPKRVLCFGGVGTGPVFNFLKTNFNCECVCVDGYALSLHYLMTFFGVDASLVELFEAEPLDVLNQFHAPQVNAKHSVFDFVKRFSGGFQILLVHMNYFQPGFFTSPPPPLITPDSIEKLKSVVASDGIVVIYFVPTSYLTLVEVVYELTRWFAKVVKIKVDENRFVVFALSDGDASTSLADVEEIIGEFKATTL